MTVEEAARILAEHMTPDDEKRQAVVRLSSDFRAAWGPEALRQKDAEDIFHTAGKRDTLIYTLVYNKEYNGPFGGIGGFPVKGKFFPTRESQTAPWEQQTDTETRRLNGDEELNSIRMRFLETMADVDAYLIRVASGEETLSDERMQEKLQPLAPFKYDSALLKKYFTILHPDVLSGYSKREKMKDLLKVMNLSTQGGVYELSHRLCQLQNSAEITYNRFYETCDQDEEKQRLFRSWFHPGVITHTNTNPDTSTMNTPKHLNQILYGPPGTGKTYNSVCYAVALADEEEKIPSYEKSKPRYDALVAEGRIRFLTFHQSYGYEDFIEGIRPVLRRNDAEDAATSQIEYELHEGVFREFCKEAQKEDKKKFVLIIDEINRGNVSKIFGELITLIEDSKRQGKEEAASVLLPLSGEEFSVPENVYILGTMNTADRSIALLDTALRRRFHFVEMMPKPELLTQSVKVGKNPLSLHDLLDVMNQRIECLFDREHTIGHAFFMKVKSVADLAEVFENKVIPLLQEYFHDDYSRMQLVLGKTIVEEATNQVSWPVGVEAPENVTRYTINKDALKKLQTYRDAFGI